MKTGLTAPSSLSTALAALALLAAAPLPAQTTGSSETSSSPSQPAEEVVRMSQFEVTTTQGHGYVATNSAQALKTTENIMDIPQGIMVMSRDLIDDIGNVNTTDTLQFFGAGNGFVGESNSLRGVSVSYAYVDDMPENQPYEDDAITDSYQILKGPAQVLYVNSRLTGVILRVLKKPLPFYQNTVTAQVNDWGQYRFTGDFTGPMGTVGDAKLGYRVVLVDQGGGNWQDNVKDDRKIIFGSFEVTLKNTTVRVTYDYQWIYGIGGGEDVITPTGQLYTGAGRSETEDPRNSMFYNPDTRFSAHVLSKISDNWESRFQASVWNLLRYGGTWVSSSVNWATGIVTFQPRLDNVDYSYWTAMEDITGHYDIGPIPNRDAFGFAYTDYTNKVEVWTTASGLVSFPVNSAAAFNSYIMPQWYQYSPPANQGSYTKTAYGEIYWMHTVEAVPKWLSLVGGWTWDYAAANSVTNISTLPWIDTLAPVEQFVHRIGAVLKVTNQVSVYALEATTFSPAAGSSVLENGQLAPPQIGKDEEVGFKTNLLGGRISSDFAYFHMSITNVLEIGGLNNGVNFFVPVGSTNEEGVDGDVAFSIVKGWQLISTFYAGHDRDQANNPVSSTYDNQLTVFTRYDFDRSGPLHGLAIGGGVARLGARWITDSGVTGATLPASGEIKCQSGTNIDGFLIYVFNRHLSAKIACDNILNAIYVYGTQGPIATDPSPPRTWYFSGSYKF